MENGFNIPINKTAIGTCSNCGGYVCVHSVWSSVCPDTPTCSSCGRVGLVSQNLSIIETSNVYHFGKSGLTSESSVIKR